VSVYHADRHASVTLVYHIYTVAWTTTPRRPERSLIVRSDKYEAEVANNRRLLTYSTRSIARPLWVSRASCYLLHQTIVTNIMHYFITYFFA